MALSSVTMYDISVVMQLHTTGLPKFAARAKGDSKGADHYLLRYRTTLKTTPSSHDIQHGKNHVVEAVMDWIKTIRTSGFLDGILNGTTSGSLHFFKVKSYLERDLGSALLYFPSSARKGQLSYLCRILNRA